MRRTGADIRAAHGTAKECLRTNFRSLSMHCKRELFEAKKGM